MRWLPLIVVCASVLVSCRPVGAEEDDLERLWTLEFDENARPEALDVSRNGHFLLCRQEAGRVSKGQLSIPIGGAKPGDFTAEIDLGGEEIVLPRRFFVIDLTSAPPTIFASLTRDWRNPSIDPSISSSPWFTPDGVFSPLKAHFTMHGRDVLFATSGGVVRWDFRKNTQETVCGPGWEYFNGGVILRCESIDPINGARKRLSLTRDRFASPDGRVLAIREYVSNRDLPESFEYQDEIRTQEEVMEEVRSGKLEVVYDFELDLQERLAFLETTFITDRTEDSYSIRSITTKEYGSFHDRLEPPRRSFSFDGSRYAAISEPGRVGVWRTDCGKRILVVDANEGEQVERIQLSLDGNVLLVRFRWEDESAVQEGVTLKEFVEAPVCSMLVAAFADPSDKRPRLRTRTEIHDIDAKKQIASINDMWENVALSPDGSVLYRVEHDDSAGGRSTLIAERLGAD